MITVLFKIKIKIQKSNRLQVPETTYNTSIFDIDSEVSYLKESKLNSKESLILNTQTFTN